MRLWNYILYVLEANVWYLTKIYHYAWKYSRLYGHEIKTWYGRLPCYQSSSPWEIDAKRWHYSCECSGNYTILAIPSYFDIFNWLFLNNRFIFRWWWKWWSVESIALLVAAKYNPKRDVGHDDMKPESLFLVCYVT